MQGILRLLVLSAAVLQLTFAQGWVDDAQNAKLDAQQRHMMHLMNAPIDDTQPLTEEDIRRFALMVSYDKSMYGEAYPAMKKGLQLATQEMTNVADVTFESYIGRAIARSGKKEMLDANARRYGYADALEQTVKAHRIIRAMMVLSMREQFTAMTLRKRSAMEKRIRHYIPHIHEPDIESILPYMPFLSRLGL